MACGSAAVLSPHRARVWAAASHSAVFLDVPFWSLSAGHDRKEINLKVEKGLILSCAVFSVFLYCSLFKKKRYTMP